MSLMLHQQKAIVLVATRRSRNSVTVTREIGEVVLWFLSIWWLVQIGLMARQLIITSHQVSYQVNLVVTSFLVALAVGFVSWRLMRYESNTI